MIQIDAQVGKQGVPQHGRSMTLLPVPLGDHAARTNKIYQLFGRGVKGAFYRRNATITSATTWGTGFYKYVKKP